MVFFQFEKIKFNKCPNLYIIKKKVCELQKYYWGVIISNSSIK